MNAFRRARAELERLVAALGHAVEGGDVYDGAVLWPLPDTPGAPAAPAPPRLLLRIEAWPLPERARAALVGAGYAPADPDGRRFRGPDGARLELCAFDDDADAWLERLAVRALLGEGGAVPAAAADAAYRDPARTEAATARLRDAVGFAPPLELLDLFAGLDARWSVASGWALDLHRDAPARLHDDLDVAVPYDDQLPLLRRLRARGWRLDVPVGPGNGVGGGVYAPWDGDPVAPPLAQVHARPVDDLLGGRLIDVLLTPADAASWRFRRDPEVRLPWQRARLWRDLGDASAPYLAPEIVCLYKMGGAGGRDRGKDDRDLERAVPRLGEAARSWLRAALRRRHPDSPWLERL